MGEPAAGRGSLQNSACAVYAAGIRLTSSGNYLTLVLPLIFSANLSGPLLTWASANGSGGTHSDSSSTPGAWTVPEGQCRSSLDSTALFDAREARGTATVAIEPGCPWMATSNVDWVTVTSGDRGEGGGTLEYTVRANTDASPRAGWITAAGQTLVLGQAARTTTGPRVARNGVLNAASLKPETGITAGSWFTVNGLNLAATTRSWQPSDFTGSGLPTQLDGTSVMINGKLAYVRRVSPMQIEALAPDDSTEGRVAVDVYTAQGRSNGVMVSKQKFAPALYSNDAGGRRYVAATPADGTPAGSPGNVAARPGETILLQGTGFGPSRPAHPAAELVSEPVPALYTPYIRIGNLTARVLSAALVSPGVSQFEVVIPDPGDGDHPVVAELGLSITPGSVYLAVAREPLP